MISTSRGLSAVSGTPRGINAAVAAKTLAADPILYEALTS
jgi:hypothetical protein